MENKFNNMMNKKIFNRFIVAIQDLNRYEKLETIVPNSTKLYLQHLRNKRIDDCHYLNDNDDQTTIDDKRTILEIELKTMPVGIQDIFNKKYPNLLNDIIGYVVKNKTTPTLYFVDDMKEWFYD